MARNLRFGPNTAQRYTRQVSPAVRTKLRVLAVGQTPPPFHGQAVAFDAFVRGSYERIEVTHIRMAFSRDVGEAGQVALRKILKLPVLVVRILYARLRTGSEVLYYPPAATGRAPLLRDVVVLVCCRWAFRHTVLHLHSGGLADAYGQLGPLMQRLFCLAYGSPDVAVVLSEHGLDDAGLLSARHRAVVPNGVADEAANRAGARPANAVPVIVYLGSVRETKGALVLAEACALLAEQAQGFSARLVGGFQPPQFEAVLRRRLEELGLGDVVHVVGPRLGEDKWSELLGADVFCFPSFYEDEGQPLALLEAMSVGLPVVATCWRGSPSVVTDGESGYLVAPHDAAALAERLQMLLGDEQLRHSFGEAGRSRYLAEFTLERYRERLQDALCLVRT